MRATAVLARKWRSFASYTSTTRWLFPVAFVLLGAARLTILLLPFRLYARWLGRRDDSRAASAAPADTQTAMDIARAVRAAAGITPWQSICLPQALAAVTLLRAFGLAYTAHLGVARGRSLDKPMEAHAWVRSGDVVLTGAGEIGRYAVVATYRGSGKSD